MPSLARALQATAAMRSEQRRRARPRKWPRPRWPHKQRLEYYRVLLAMVERVQALVRRELFPALPALIDAHNVSRPEDEPVRFDTEHRLGWLRCTLPKQRFDATGSKIDEAFDALREAAAEALPDRTIEMEAQKNALRVSKWHAEELGRQVEHVIQINLFDDAAGLAEHLEVFVADNVSLVKSLAHGQLDDLKGILMRAARQGLHHSVVAEQIEERFKITQKRAALIANDQVGKLNGELNQIRQQRLGVKRYRWSSSQDERVRPRHRQLNGTIQEWTKPPVVDLRTGERAHPGQPIRCRCQPIPIIDDVLVEAGLMAPEDAELGMPLPGPLPPPSPTPPKPLPRLPPAVPQPPPANVAKRRRPPRRAPAPPAPPPSPPSSPPSPPSSPPSPPSMRSVPKGLPKPLPANLGPARQKAATNPKPGLPPAVPAKGAKVGTTATPPQLPADVQPPAWMLDPQPHVTHNPADVIKEKGASESMILRFKTAEGEKKGLWKPLDPEKAWRFGTENSEAAAAALDRLLHGQSGAVVPPTVARELAGRRGSLQEIVPNAIGSVKDVASEIAADPARWAAQPSMRKTFLEDVLTRNIDRHHENVLFTRAADGSPVAHAIDNGYAFRTLGEHAKHNPRFAFPVEHPAFANTLLELDAASVATIRSANLSSVAELLHAHNLEPDQVYETLVRLKSLQKAPTQLKALIGGTFEESQLRLTQWLGRTAEAHGLSTDEIAELRRLARQSS